MEQQNEARKYAAHERGAALTFPSSAEMEQWATPSTFDNRMEISSSAGSRSRENA
jgi:hypothetical protein